MTSADDTIRALRTALAHGPDNLPLRLHLASTLLDLNRATEAEAEYKDALRRAPGDDEVRLGLVRAFMALEKRAEAFVLIEEVIRTTQVPGPAYLLHARLLYRDGQAGRAAREYQKAVDADPAVADPAFGAQLEVDPATADQPDDDAADREPAGPDGAGTPQFGLERPDINFDAVGGLDAVKEQIRFKIIEPLLHPEIYAAYGKKIGGGILLYGPPGCGKTHLARATAGQIRASFIAVGIHDVLEMWVGQSERNLHAIFQQARRAKPCVLFFDEVDALAARRSDMVQSAGRHVINQFLDEMDGVATRNDGVLVLAATNAPWHIDSAFRRPGRFDRVLFVPPPDEAARVAILQVELKGKPVDKLDFAGIARKTERFSGADLKAVVDVAIESKLKEAIRRGAPAPITTADLLGAVKQVKPSTTDWFATARNYVLFANEGGLYDDVRPWLKG